MLLINGQLRYFDLTEVIGILNRNNRTFEIENTENGDINIKCSRPSYITILKHYAPLIYITGESVNYTIEKAIIGTNFRGVTHYVQKPKIDDPFYYVFKK